jgi:hypothetical protein
MPRYFFDFSDDGHASQDDDGSELTDLDAAREYAFAVLLEMARGAVVARSISLRVSIRDQPDGDPLLEASLVMSFR